MTTGFRNLKVSGDLGKSSSGGMVERESLTGVGSRENGKKVNLRQWVRTPILRNFAQVKESALPKNMRHAFIIIEGKVEWYGHKCRQVGSLLKVLSIFSVK